MAKRAIAKKKRQSRAVAPNSFFEEHAGSGMEEVQASDLVISRLAIIQKMSPELDESKAEHIKSAKEGMIADKGTLEASDSILFLPIKYKKNFVEWWPRKSGKGIANIWPDDSILKSCVPDADGRPSHNGNLVVETANFFGYSLNDEGEAHVAYIGMHGTQLKKARQWMTMATVQRLENAEGEKYQAPLWYKTYLLGSKPESNAQGSWHGWTVEMADDIEAYCKRCGANFEEFCVSIKSIIGQIDKLGNRAVPQDGDTAAEEAM